MRPTWLSTRDELHDLMHDRSVAREHLRGRIGLIAIATLLLDAAGTLLAFMFEHHATGTAITSLGTAAFWTTTQLLTVSSSLPNPVTTGGRILDVVLEAWALVVVGGLAGSFGAFFHRRSLERAPMESPTPRQ